MLLFHLFSFFIFLLLILLGLFLFSIIIRIHFIFLIFIWFFITFVSNLLMILIPLTTSCSKTNSIRFIRRRIIFLKISRHSFFRNKILNYFFNFLKDHVNFLFQDYINKLILLGKHILTFQQIALHSIKATLESL